MSRLALVPLALLVLNLAGCGTPAKPLPMVVAPVDALQLRGWVPDALKAQVAVAPVRGGGETGRWWGSLVSAGVLQHALEESLHAVGMRALMPEPVPRFELQAHLVLLEQPTVPPLAATVGVAVQYTLTEKASGRVVYQRRIYNQEEAGLTDALVSPPDRVRIANERAVRANINLLLRDLVTLRP
ncbi:hypothetical protein [Roseateles asaccharophilus]|uniref:ABC-type transport auxiliary lipoprotein component domain-containing protein n=1 Tax=Roseateles asaccharophilus TaxID=582607 RepID=A0ABU2A7I3_9BURK|nr:hypothetical protein [Roseateles asaccharophilus]MDR7333121.1 hypothetical protein [Roseateles asaccharophilus]